MCNSLTNLRIYNFNFHSYPEKENYTFVLNALNCAHLRSSYTTPLSQGEIGCNNKRTCVPSQNESCSDD